MHRDAKENIWGLYNQLTDRDAELLRRSATLLRWAGQRHLALSREGNMLTKEFASLQGT